MQLAAEKTGVRIDASTAARMQAAELVLNRIADTIDDRGPRGQKMPHEAHIRTDGAHSVRTSMDAVDKLFVNGGAAGLSLQGIAPARRHDLHAINRHAPVFRDTGAGTHGRPLFGRSSFNTAII